MLRIVKSPINRWNIFWLAIGLGGCAIADSTVIDLNIPSPPGVVTCSSALGSYSLPKAFIRVKVGEPASPVGGKPDLVFPDPPPEDKKKLSFQVVRRPDPAMTVCLDHLNSVFAADEIYINKYEPPDGAPYTWQGRQFLQSVIFNASDRSVQIARNLIRALFIGISGDSGFVPEREGLLESAAPHILADLEFDPFDVSDTTATNSRLAKFGICLVLEDFTFDKRSLSVDQYCNAPDRVRQHMPYIAELYEARSRDPIPPQTPGVLYRPRQAYLLSSYRKDARGRGWFLSRQVKVELENLSPVISLGISRAIFAKRNALLLFEEGTLKTACTAKSSEVENFVAIPFEIARSLIALPATIVSVRINRTGKQTELANAEKLFIQMQSAMADAKKKGGRFTSAGSVPESVKINVGAKALPDLNAAPVGFEPALDIVRFNSVTLKGLIQAVCDDPTPLTNG